MNLMAIYALNQHITSILILFETDTHCLIVNKSITQTNSFSLTQAPILHNKKP